MSLSRLGYQVLDASDGINALAVWKAHGDEIQLVLIEMVMPGVINGIEAGSEPQAGTAPLAPSQARLILPLLHRVPIHIQQMQFANVQFAEAGFDLGAVAHDDPD